ncbi:hypothetical protein [Roseateles albus]|uniref:4Fe-4S ferredoxin-type domain-containing protein n=1 Tax=Roseateles albus TaxID=2987525 RepID=A0ABT5KCJ5_9BURK|nr:hypothetical protein [Roseateles albus]MDC8770715.1 hypothetical protein [Roseateles albus]
MPEQPHQVIHIHPAAPPKPAEGAPCNGCGVCCLSAPCPIGMLVSRRLRGACSALQWSDSERRYVCGMLIAPLQVLGWRGAATGRLSMLLTRISARWIAAGIGCDSNLQVSGQPQLGQATRVEGESEG